MRKRPILLNGDMVRAVLNGSKTQTRRILTPHQLKMIEAAAHAGECYPLESGHQHANSQSYYREWCPFGLPGDRLWVRETFRVHSRATDVATLVYKASERQSWTEQTHRVPVSVCNKPAVNEKWTPSIHMPRWASRITLEITGVRVERLASLNNDDARAEGYPADRAADGGNSDPWLWFRELWDGIYPEQSFKVNPWVWVIEFRRVEGER